MNVDTCDGRNSFHATAMAVYQQEPSMNGTQEELTEYANPTQSKAARSWEDVPKTVILLIPSSITDTRKPHTSPQYPNFKLGTNEEDDLAWLVLCLYCCNGVNLFNDPVASQDSS